MLAVITLTNGITKVTSQLLSRFRTFTTCRARFDDSDLAGHCFLPFHLNRHVSVQFGLGARTQRGDSSFTVFSEEQDGTCQRGERGLRGAKVSPACNICDRFNGFICLFLEQML